jgi:hypothetical protein
MTQPNHDADERLDGLLRDVGPDVPQPALSDEARARLLATMDDTSAHKLSERGRRTRGGMKWAAVAGIAAVFALAPLSVFLWVELGRVKDALTTSHWETGEALQLLMIARYSQPSVAAPEEVEGLDPSDLMVVTFHHDLCPLARHCTPAFKAMAERFDGGAARFIAFDVTGSKRDQAGKEIDELGIRFALFSPPGAETGVVKVIDTAHERLLCSAPGRRGLEQAEMLLGRVQEAVRRP